MESEPIRFLLDEHVERAIAEGLVARGADALTAQSAGRTGDPDESLLEFARREGRVLVTRDADFLSLAPRIHDHAGVVFVPSRRRDVGAIIGHLMLIREVVEPGEIRGRIEFL